MSKAKVSSRNNPSARGSKQEYLYDGKKIVPVKLVTEKSSFMAAEYENGELVVDKHGTALSWRFASQYSTNA